MKQARIKLPEGHVKLLIQGKAVTINLPDVQIELTMDMTRIEMKKAADGFAGVGKKPSPFDDFDLPDFMNERDSKGRESFRDIFQGVFDKSRR